MTRTSGGHRRIEVADLLEYARRENLPVRATPSDSASPLPDLATLSEMLFKHFERGDAVSVRRLLTAVSAQTLEPAQFCDRVVAPALRRVGDGWELGELEIYQEHAASIATSEGIAALRALIGQPSELDPQAICASLEDDPYSLGPSMCALVLQSERYRTSLLGANTPAKEIALAAANLNAQVVAVSIGAVSDEDRVVADLRDLAASTSDRGAQLVLGGRGLSLELRTRIEADFFGDTMVHLARFARNLRRNIDDIS